MTVEVNGLAQRRIFFLALEERWLYRRDIAVSLTQDVDDCSRIDPLVHMKRNGRCFEGRVLLLARPDQLRIKMRIVIQVFARFYRRDWLNVVVDLVGRERWIGLGCD